MFTEGLLCAKGFTCVTLTSALGAGVNYGAFLTEEEANLEVK